MAVVLVALQADVADARRRQQLQHGVEHAEAGAQHRHDHDVGAHDPGVGRPSGVVTVAASVGRSRSASAARSRLIRLAARAECGRRRAGVAQLHQRIVDERVIDEVERHGP